MFHIRHSLAFCRFRSISFRPLSTTTTRPIRRRKQVVSRLKQQTDEETEFKSKIQRNEMLKETNDVFVAKDKDGNELTMEEYLKFASLSPWVPVPDVVARRCLDIVKAGPDDVSNFDHYVLLLIIFPFLICSLMLYYCSNDTPRSIMNLVQGMEGLISKLIIFTT